MTNSSASILPTPNTVCVRPRLSSQRVQTLTAPRGIPGGAGVLVARADTPLLERAMLIEADVESGVIEVQLQGACSSCAISSATLQGGVERILKGRLEWVTEVQGGVDESADPFESAALGQGGYVPKW